jgi:hypothetical protein
MAKVILVHGIDQQDEESDRLRGVWLEAIHRGLLTVAQPTLASRIDESNVAMAFYGDLFRKAGAQGTGPFESLPPDAELLADRLASEWLTRAAERSSHDGLSRAASDALAGELLAAKGEPQGLRSGARRSLAALAKFPAAGKAGFALAERLVPALSQVTLYLTNTDATRDIALKRLEAHITVDTAIIIGHSLGSVVAYEACHRAAQPIPLLVTIGSPLGLDTVVFERVIPQPPRYPPKVAWWVNVADVNDIVAADTGLGQRFKPTPGAHLTDHTVDNWRHAHDAMNYLVQPEVAYPLALTLLRVP